MIWYVRPMKQKDYYEVECRDRCTAVAEVEYLIGQDPDMIVLREKPKKGACLTRIKATKERSHDFDYIK